MTITNSNNAFEYWECKSVKGHHRCQSEVLEDHYHSQFEILEAHKNCQSEALEDFKTILFPFQIPNSRLSFRLSSEEWFWSILF